MPSNDQRPYILTHKYMFDDWLLCTVTSTDGRHYKHAPCLVGSRRARRPGSSHGAAGRSVMFRLELTKMGQVWAGKN